MSVENLIDEFSEKQKELGKAEGTIKTYVGILKKFQSWLAAKNRTIDQISKEDVQLYINYLEKQEKNAATIEKYLAAISVFLRFLGRSDIQLDVQRKEKIKDEDVPESLGKNDEKQLLKKVKADGNLRNIAIVYTLLFTGIRISELCALKPNDIEIIAGKATLLVRNEKGEIERTIPVATEAWKHLQKYIRTLNVRGVALFVTSVNKRISTRAVQYMLQKYDVHPQKLRHTFCQKLVNKGIDIHTVAKLAGHKDVNVTKRYAGIFDTDLERAIDRAFS